MGKFYPTIRRNCKKILELILSIIPQNIVSPFLDRNILQIVFLALIIGIVTTTLGSSVADFRNLITNLRQIAFRIMRLVMKLIPLIIFLCILKTAAVSSFDQIAGVWKIVAAEWILFAVISLAALLRTSLKYDLKIVDLVKAFSPAFLISFTTGSGSASMPKNIEVCEKVLKIDKSLCEFYIPLSHALCPIPMIIGIIICTFYAAEFAGAQISLAQILVIAFLAIQFAISSTGGNGGMIATMTLMLTQVGLPLEAIGPMTLTDIFVVNLSGVITVIVRDCDLIDVSHEVSFEGK
ncbi:MAG: cation:dicarboxylase symporter family transporter [Selenomonadaceae bacterium]|nr:cation:dicarboxylase symporter family transporter [Selenomonadaceae bacterium]